MRHLSALAITLTLCTLAAPATAQEAPPIALPVTPDAAACTTAPITVEQVLDLVETRRNGATPATDPTPTPTPDAFFAPPEGQPADAATVSAITATMYEALACTNAGDQARVLALFGDDLLAEFFAGSLSSGSEEDIAAVLQPVAVPADDRAALLAVSYARVLDDGRVGAFVDVGDGQGAGAPTEISFVTFAPRDGRYAIVGLVEDLEETFPPAAETEAVGTPER